MNIIGECNKFQKILGLTLQIFILSMAFTRGFWCREVRLDVSYLRHTTIAPVGVGRWQISHCWILGSLVLHHFKFFLVGFCHYWGRKVPSMAQGRALALFVSNSFKVENITNYNYHFAPRTSKTLKGVLFFNHFFLQNFFLAQNVITLFLIILRCAFTTLFLIIFRKNYFYNF